MKKTLLINAYGVHGIDLNSKVDHLFGPPKEITMKLTFEEWSEENEQGLDCLFAESGADREMDFDRETAEEVEYEKYLNSKE